MFFTVSWRWDLYHIHSVTAERYITPTPETAGGVCDDEDPIAASVYDDLAAEYDEITTAPIRELYEWPVVEEILPPLEGTRILDAACGDGTYLERFRDRGATGIGVDASAAMVHRARSRFADCESISIERADLRDGLDFLADDGFDLVVCQLALEHIRCWEPVFETFARVLRPGGVAVVSTSHPVRDYVDAAFDQRAVVQADSAAYSAVERVNRDWGDTESFLVPFYRRPLQAVFDPATAVGFAVTQVVEPEVTDRLRAVAPDWVDRLEGAPPLFVCVRLRLPGDPG